MFAVGPFLLQPVLAHPVVIHVVEVLGSGCRCLSPRKLHPLFSPKHVDFVTVKNSFFCHLENTVFQTLPKNAFLIRFAHFLLFLGGSNNHSLVQNQRVYRSFSPKKHFVG